MSQELYYTPPSQESFEDMKKCAISLWQEYDDTYGYATDKVHSIIDIANVGDNFMYIFAMFDIVNQSKLTKRLSEETMKELKLRLPDEYKRYLPLIFTV